jgi:uncharacterized phiE125 gp8 family phage protein
MSWLETVVTVPPTDEPISTADAKAQCRVDGTTADDGLIDGLVKAARIHVEKYCGIRLFTQTIEMRCSSFSDFASLADAPIASITSIEYLDPTGTLQTLDPAVYEALLYGLSPRVRLKPNQSFPAVYRADDAITVTAVAGFGAAADIEDPILHAIKLLVGQWYDNRAPIAVGDTVNELPNAVTALLANYRRF